MSDATPYFSRLAAAYVRGSLLARSDASEPAELLSMALDALSPGQLDELVMMGRQHDIRLHRFKRTMGLPRVEKVLGILRGLQPASLLDVGSGRGAFLWPFLEAFPGVPVVAADRLEHRAADIRTVSAGGVGNLQAWHGDVTRLPFEDRAFDVVTMLEVLEHIPDAPTALAHAIRVADRFLILSVPSREDENPEHIHLFSAATLEQRLSDGGASRVTFTYVPGHLIAVARRAT